MNTEQKNENKNLKEYTTLAVTAFFYIIFNFRYAPDQLSATLSATLFQLLSTAPLVAGMTFALVVFLNKLAGERLPWNRIIRVYFTLGIIVGFLYALNEYWERG